MMTFNEYREQALTTAVYTGRKTIMGPIYCALKLAGEASELDIALQSYGNGIKPAADVILEMGDVAWYVAAFSDEYDLDIEYGSYTAANAYVLTRRVMQEAGAIAEMHGKAMRDGNNVSKMEVATRLGTILGLVVTVAQMLGYDGGTVFSENIRKLRDRKARGVLGGSGDHR